MFHGACSASSGPSSQHPTKCIISQELQGQFFHGSSGMKAEKTRGCYGTFTVHLSSPHKTLTNAIVCFPPQLKLGFMPAIVSRWIKSSKKHALSQKQAWPIFEVLSVTFLFHSVPQFLFWPETKALINREHAVALGIHFNRCKVDRACLHILSRVAFTYSVMLQS